MHKEIPNPLSKTFDGSSQQSSPRSYAQQAYCADKQQSYYWFTTEDREAQSHA